MVNASRKQYASVFSESVPESVPEKTINSVIMGI